MTSGPTSDRERWLNALATTAARDSQAACPRPSEIWEAATGQPEQQALHAVLDHLASCADCAEDWRLAREIVSGDAAPQRAGRRTPKRSPEVSRFARLGWVSAIAATVAFVLVGGVVSPPGWRSPAAPATSRAATQPEIHLTTHTSERGCLIEWGDVPGATYSVQIFDRQLDLLTEELRLDEARLEIPSELEGLDLWVFVSVRRGPEGVLAESTTEVACRVS